MTILFKDIKKALGFLHITGKESLWAARNVLVNLSADSVKFSFATPFEYKTKDRICCDPVEWLNKVAEDENEGHRLYSVENLGCQIIVDIYTQDYGYQVPINEFVGDVSVFQALLSEKKLKTVELFVDTDHKRWGFKTPTGVEISSGELKDTTVLGKTKYLYSLPVLVNAEESPIGLSNGEAKKVLDACPQAEESLREEPLRCVLGGINLRARGDFWYAYSTDGRTLTEYEIKTPNNLTVVSEPFNHFLLNVLKWKAIAGFKEVRLTPCYVQANPNAQTDSAKDEKRACYVQLEEGSLNVEFVTLEQEGVFPAVDAVIPDKPLKNHVEITNYDVEAICDTFYNSFSNTKYHKLNESSEENLYIYFQADETDRLVVTIKQRSYKKEAQTVKQRELKLNPAFPKLNDTGYMFFNAKLFVNLLRELTNNGEDAVIEFDDQYSPAVLTSTVGKAVVMPMRSLQ